MRDGQYMLIKPLGIPRPSHNTARILLQYHVRGRAMMMLIRDEAAHILSSHHPWFYSRLQGGYCRRIFGQVEKVRMRVKSCD